MRPWDRLNWDEVHRKLYIGGDNAFVFFIEPDQPGGKIKVKLGLKDDVHEKLIGMLPCFGDKPDLSEYYEESYINPEDYQGYRKRVRPGGDGHCPGALAAL